MATPAAIVLGSVIIAVGVWLGLRGQGPPAPAAPVATPPPFVATPPAMPVVPHAQVVRHASEALGYQRSQLLERCYLPRVAGMESPIRVSILFNVTFDAHGNQIGRGIVEEAGTSSPEITGCINEAMAPLTVPPPGAVVMVEIPLRFP